MVLFLVALAHILHAQIATCTVMMVHGGGSGYIYIYMTTTCGSRVNVVVGDGKRPPVQVTECRTTCASRVNALVGGRKDHQHK